MCIIMSLSEKKPQWIIWLQYEWEMDWCMDWTPARQDRAGWCNTVLNVTAWMHMAHVEIQHPEMLEHSFYQHAKQGLLITLTSLLVLVYHLYGIFELPHMEII